MTTSPPITHSAQCRELTVASLKTISADGEVPTTRLSVERGTKRALVSSCTSTTQFALVELVTISRVADGPGPSTTELEAPCITPSVGRTPTKVARKASSVNLACWRKRRDQPTAI